LSPIEIKIKRSRPHLIFSREMCASSQTHPSLSPSVRALWLRRSCYREYRRRFESSK